MKPHHTRLAWPNVLVAAAALTILLACNLTTTRVGELRTETTSVALEDATSVEATVIIGVGELTVGGGADDLLDATFSYNVDEWEPEVDYRVRNGEGILEVRQPETSTSGIPDDDLRNAWNLEFNESIPLDMRVTLGFGESELDFSDLTLTNLDISAGAGDTFINVGSQDANRVSINAGLGKVNLRIPGGSIDAMNIKMGAGSMDIDMRGLWEDDLDATISGGLGELILQLPRDVGVRVQAQAGLGSIEARDFDRDGNAYVNDAYGESDITLDINIDAGVGTVRLELGE